MRANALLGRDAVMRHGAGRAEVRARMWLAARAAGCRMAQWRMSIGDLRLNHPLFSRPAVLRPALPHGTSIDMLALLVQCPYRCQACSHALQSQRHAPQAAQ